MPCISIFFCLERLAWRPRRWDQLIRWYCRPTTFLVSLPRLPSVMPSIRTRCRESCLTMWPKKYDSFLIRTITYSFLLIVTPLRLWHIVFSLFLAFASVSTFKRLLGAATIFWWWSMSRVHPSTNVGTPFVYIFRIIIFYCIIQCFMWFHALKVTWWEKRSWSALHYSRSSAKNNGKRKWIHYIYFGVWIPRGVGWHRLLKESKNIRHLSQIPTKSPVDRLA